MRVRTNTEQATVVRDFSLEQLDSLAWASHTPRKFGRSRAQNVVLTSEASDSSTSSCFDRPSVGFRREADEAVMLAVSEVLMALSRL